MEQFQAEREEVLLLLERVSDAQRLAAMQMKEADAGKKGKRKGEDGDDEGGADQGDNGEVLGDYEMLRDPKETTAPWQAGQNDGSLQVGGSLAQSGLCSPPSSSFRTSYRPRTSGFLSFSRAPDKTRGYRPLVSASGSGGGVAVAAGPSPSVPIPEPPLTPQPTRHHHLRTPYPRFSRLGASLDSATANQLLSIAQSHINDAAADPDQRRQPPASASQPRANQSSDPGGAAASGGAAGAVAGGSEAAAKPGSSGRTTPPPPPPPASPSRSTGSGGSAAATAGYSGGGGSSTSALPSTAKVASTMGINVPAENLRASERPAMGVSTRGPGHIIQVGGARGGRGGIGEQGIREHATRMEIRRVYGRACRQSGWVPLGVPSPRSHQAQVAMFKATRGHALMVFNELDSDKNGKVTRSEFEAAALSLGFSLEQAQRFWERLDRRHRGFLEALDWGTKDAFQQIQLFSTRYMQKYMGVPDVSSSPEQVRKYNRNQELMQVKSLAAAVNMVRANAVARGVRLSGSSGNAIFDTFRFMDVDGSGVLSKEEIRDAFFALGVFLAEPVAEQIMQLFDKNGNGTVQYHEFEAAMFPPSRGT
ncbi:hypothetical protein VOLCADRAFT_120569 [Volvox carteri f. nagariensis]|uniref:EF-hand domain-containing protein n=1 Tax=Volvox carteri f. nagariensis TaxID=3068 RepID=D8TNZ7_VOLCA|nr:uncharacterized protein VOLCADRAFT_120569 [Volvox carteri f. nagariensis]EFJ50673.1 hypothetical protein VOLCADRAFT_120569 [Volvox carteri f. nagariensis]|eukprot:XP_002948266.1 hypothetical protein VOLCADRAFT_120569 [Volvox carteri f. nagariensis]